jgi:hypothetical protein
MIIKVAVFRIPPFGGAPEAMQACRIRVGSGEKLVKRLDRAYIGGIERGERNVWLVNIERIARAQKIFIPRLFKNVSTRRATRHAW